MKKFFALSLLAVSTFASANNITANGTRFIYPSNEKEITVQLNNNAPRPALVQTWLDTGNANMSPDQITTPFTITPPIAKVEGKQGQTLRIRNIDKNNMAKDKESLWYLNILEIPPSNAEKGEEGKNVLMTAIRSRFKFIYRPVGLKGRNDAADKLVLKASGNNLMVENPTPFYITITRITRSGAMVNTDGAMVEPKGHVSIPLKTTVKSNEKLTVGNLNDFGAEVKSTLITQ